FSSLHAHSSEGDNVAHNEEISRPKRGQLPSLLRSRDQPAAYIQALTAVSRKTRKPRSVMNFLEGLEKTGRKRHSEAAAKH
ncbi:MAG: hypothetical protein J6331_00490, partial [Lentisphaeria bacterium]|nr:hypothetical protein [Lentisphaeria bacterium]